MITEVFFVIFEQTAEGLETSLAKVRGLRRYFPGVEINVCNNGMDQVLPVPGLRVFEKHNDHGEFSAWQHMYENRRTLGPYLFINDTVFKNSRLFGIDYLFLRLCMVRMRGKSSYILGVRHVRGMFETPVGFYSGHINSRFWICDQACAQHLSLVSAEIAAIVLSEAEMLRQGRYFTGYEPCHDFISTWLNGGGWYKSRPLQQENVGLFRYKCIMILQEWAMTIKAQDEGIMVYVLPFMPGRIFKIPRRLAQMFMAVLRR